MGSEWRDGIPQLREETRAAQGRVVEFLATAVLISTLLGVGLNLGTDVLTSALNVRDQLIVIVGTLAAGLLFTLLLVPRITTTIKEFQEEIEIVLPLLVSQQDIEVIHTANYDEMTELARAALAKRSPDERHELAQLLSAPHAEEQYDARRKILAHLLEIAQFLLVAELVKGSRRLLGPEAAYHKLRDVALLQTGVASTPWDQLAQGATGNRYLAVRTLGIPEKVLLPTGVRIMIPEVAPAVFGKAHRQKKEAPGLEHTTLFSVTAGRDTALRVSALMGFSEHGLPTLNAPQRGLTARCVLRNARNARLRELARAEEAAAEELRDERRSGRKAAGQRESAAPAPAVEAAERHAAAYARLYGGGQRPHLIRLFVRLEGSFRIRLLSGDRQRGLYAWGAALSRILAAADIEIFLATLKEHGQRVPCRTF